LVTVFGPLGALVLGHAMSDAPNWVWVVVGILCAVAGTLIVCLADPVHGWLIGMGRRASLLIIALACVIAGAIALALLTTATGRANSTALLLDYEPIDSLKVVGPGQKLYAFHIAESPLDLMSEPEGSTPTPGEGHGPFVYRCTVSNKGDATLLELDFSYRVTFFEGMPFDSREAFSTVRQIRWPALAPSESFTFYIANSSAFGVAFEARPEVRAKVLGKERTRKLNVLTGSWGNFSFQLDSPRYPRRRTLN
jgi:hypothetical protein